MTPDANDLCVFAVKRGDIVGRFDVTYILPKYTQLLEKIAQSRFASDALRKHILVCESGYNYEQSDIESLQTTKLLRTQNVKPIFINDQHVSFVLSTKIKALTIENDLLFVRVGAGVGDCAFVEANQRGMTFSDNVLRVHFDKNYYGPYIAAFLSTDVGKSLLLRQAKGSGKPVISRESIENQIVPLPSIEQQQQLFSKLKCVNCSYKALLQQADELLIEMNNYILDALAIAPIRFDSQLCCQVKMSDIVSDKTFSAEYYHSERMTAISNMKDACGSNVRKLIDIVDFCRDIVSCNDSTSKYLGLAGVESQTGEMSGVEEDAAGQAFKYEIDDVLYGRLRPYLNKVIRAEESGICSTEYHVMRVKNQSVILPEYLAAILRSDLILSQTKHMMTGNTHPRISNDDVRNLYVPVPDITVQETIVRELKKRRLEARQLKQEAEQEWAAAKAQFEKELLGE